VVLHESGKTVELGGPEMLVVVKPVHRIFHRCRSQLARYGAAYFRARDQTRMRQHVEMLHDRRQRYWELPPKLANGQVAARMRVEGWNIELASGAGAL
jgi:hypothetical protein